MSRLVGLNLVRREAPFIIGSAANADQLTHSKLHVFTL